ncbi:MAG: phage terminase large subunit [Oscillospiraceae bacterium]|nr:phage terminase large subunit [Oscillospiraceae bacterium]
MPKITIDLGVPNPKQELFYKSRALYTAYGGAKGGGKTHAVRVKATGGALRWPGIRILIIRRTYPELQQNHIEPFLRLIPKEAATYNGTQHTLYFTNGSVIKFGHYQTSTAEREYQGMEYDWIFVDEATQFTERDFRYLGGCLRGMSGAPKRFYITCNPGGVGHSWVKRLFIDRDFRAGESPSDYAFTFASVEDNKELLRVSPGYLQMLDSLPENLRRAYRHGDWDALAGAYFAEFDLSRHVVETAIIPDGWVRVRAFDYGLDALACIWVAISPSGRRVVYREVVQSGLVVSDAAQLIRDCTPPDERISATYAPPDMWMRQKDTGKTMAELFFQNGVPIVRAVNARVQGHMQIKEALKIREDGRPGLVIFKGCRELTRALQTIQADEKNPSDCATQPHDITHAVDALRYFCISREVAEAGGVEESVFGDAGGILEYGV